MHKFKAFNDLTLILILVISSVLENLQKSAGASAMAAKQHKILMELKWEQVMLH